MFQGFMQGFIGGMPTGFEQMYKCRSMAFHDKNMPESGGKICLPPSALERLSVLQISYPMMFEVKNPATSTLTHCGVLEFTAPEGVCYMPLWMMNLLLVQVGGVVNIRNVTLPKGTYVKVQPHRTAFIELSDPKTVLEVALRDFSCLTKNDVIAIRYLDEDYLLTILEVKPASYNAVSITECDIQLDFEAPLDYVEPTKPAPKEETSTTDTTNDAQTTDSASTKFTPFAGQGSRLNGKPAPKATPPVDAHKRKHRVKYVLNARGGLQKMEVDSDSATTSSESEDEESEASQQNDENKKAKFTGTGRTLKKSRR